MAAQLIDGNECARRLRAEIAAGVSCFAAREKIRPGLAVVLVGDDPASEIYVRAKIRRTEEVGMRSVEHRLRAAAAETELLALVDALNRDPAVHGILVQLPLPPQIDQRRVLAAIDPGKDVDGFHPVNAGRLATGAPSLVPCTPLGCLFLIRTIRRDLAGLDALVVGCSNIVGKPMAQLLLAEECTVTMAHARTRDLPALVRQAELLVVAAGRPGLIRGDWIRPGAIVIDVGINRVPTGEGSRIVGDVEFEAARNVAAAITPVPGGVGPMTIACLLRNTLDAARVQAGHQQAHVDLRAVSSGSVR